MNCFYNYISRRTEKQYLNFNRLNDVTVRTLRNN